MEELREMEDTTDTNADGGEATSSTPTHSYPPQGGSLSILAVETELGVPRRSTRKPPK